MLHGLIGRSSACFAGNWSQWLRDSFMTVS
jgi:hypothetical protein